MIEPYMIRTVIALGSGGEGQEGRGVKLMSVTHHEKSMNHENGRPRGGGQEGRPKCHLQVQNAFQPIL